MNTDAESNDSGSEIIQNVENLVPTKLAYAGAFIVLCFSGICGGFIGYAMMEVFLPEVNGFFLGLGTCLIAAAIVYGVSIITSLSLSASVEWKARKLVTPNSKRPSRLISDENRSKC